MSKQSPDLTTLTDEELLTAVSDNWIESEHGFDYVDAKAELRRRLTPRTLRFYKNPMDIGESEVPGAIHPPENFTWDWKDANGAWGNWMSLLEKQDAITFAQSLGMTAEFVEDDDGNV